MQKKLAAVLPAKGIGDGLLMLIASEQLRLAGYDVITCHPKLNELSDWFPDHRFEEIPENPDLIILQNDNSPLAKSLIAKRNELPLITFYPTIESHKHSPLPRDQIFDPTKPMAQNIANAIANVLSKPPSTSNSLTPPSNLTFQKYPKRIILHPLSGELKKNWSEQKFLQLSHLLEKRGYEPIFAMSPQERETWPAETPLFSSLSDIAAYIYESKLLIGNDSSLGHLASNLGLPTITLAANPKQIALWRPSWHQNQIITPPTWIPNIKGLRLREGLWQSFISPKKILRILSRKT